MSGSADSIATGGIGSAVFAPSAPDATIERTSDVVVLPDSQRHDFIERAWRFCCSTKLMVALMALFALGMAASTFINPKEDALAEIERSFADRPGILWAYHVFELHAPFKSWWFTTIILALALNNLASSIERLPRIFLVVRWPERRLTDVVLRGLRNKKTAPRGDVSADQLETAFRAARYVVSRETVGDTTYLFGERGAWTRFGVWVVHVGLLVVCLGALIAGLFSFEGNMQIPGDGGRLSYFLERLPDGVIIPHRLNFALQCDKFYLDKFKDGSPRRYASDLTVLAPDGQQLTTKKIIVNDPLEWEGMDFYQASYSELPDRAHAKISITDKTTGQTKDVEATPERPFSLGDGHVRFSVASYEENFGELGPAVQVIREEDVPGSGKSPKVSAFWVFSKYPDFDAKFRGDTFGLKFDSLEPSYATGIQVAHDPGRPVMYLGAVMVWIGLFVAFWTVHRRVWARIEPDRIVVAGAAHRNKEKFREEFDRFAAGLGLPTANGAS